MAWQRNKREILEFEDLDERDFVFKTNFSADPDVNYGRRGFNLVLRQEGRELCSPEKIDKLAEDGWNIREWTDRDGDHYTFLPVEVRFDKYPPNIFTIGSETGVMTKLDEERCGEIDSIIKNNLEYFDVAISPSFNKDRDTGEWRIKAYLNGMWVHFKEGRLDIKYAGQTWGDEGSVTDPDTDVPF